MTLIGPWYVAFRELGLYDTRLALILTHVTINLPMTVWLMRAFFREVPHEIEEAAVVDGCRPFQAFYKVTLPMVVPGLIASAILAFIFSWNEFPVALSLTSRELATVPVAIARFAQAPPVNQLAEQIPVPTNPDPIEPPPIPGFPPHNVPVPLSRSFGPAVPSETPCSQGTNPAATA